MLPYAPDKLIILAHDANVALAFSTQEPDALVTALNDAVARQARIVVIASDTTARAVVDARFDPYSAPVPGDGHLRWKVP